MPSRCLKTEGGCGESVRAGRDRKYDEVEHSIATKRVVTGTTRYTTRMKGVSDIAIVGIQAKEEK